ncbi:MAG TPA: hypothetical protein VF128_11435 [Gemmatimonadaceae bacterium]|jgi:hypothetical protein
MKALRILTVLGVLAVPAHAAETRTYVGVVTDTMCGLDHVSMKNGPDTKCVRECVGDGRTYKYAIAVGARIYTLSDQETPATFAGEKVKVTGVLYPKTNILKVERIERLSGR